MGAIGTVIALIQCHLLLVILLLERDCSIRAVIFITSNADGCGTDISLGNHRVIFDLEALNLLLEPLILNLQLINDLLHDLLLLFGLGIVSED